MTAAKTEHRCDWCDRVLDPVVRHAQRNAHNRGGATIRREDVRAAERETGMAVEVAR